MGDDDMEAEMEKIQLILRSPILSAEPEAAPVENEEPTTSNDEAENSFKRKKGAEKRISELVAKQRAAERELERYKALAEGKGEAPNPDDYEAGEYDPRYIAAVATAEIKAEQRREAVEQQAAVDAELNQQKQAAFQSQIEAAKSRYDDFEQVALNPNLPITDDLAQVIAASEKGADLAYYLGKNPQEAAELVVEHLVNRTRSRKSRLLRQRIPEI